MTVRIGPAKDRILLEAKAFGVLERAGAVPHNPRSIVTGARATRRLGPVGGLPAMLAATFSTSVALIDELGEMTYAEFAASTYALANGLRSVLPSQPTVGLMCRNHRYALMALYAANAAGARVVLLNTDLGAKQIDEICTREQMDSLIHDEEFTEVVAAATCPTLLAWTTEVCPPNSVKRLVHSSSSALPPKPSRVGSIVIMTSGTTGTPKGAQRGEVSTLLLPAGLLSKIPIRRGDSVMLSAPVFHGWGLLVAMLTMTTGSTLVLQRRFDATRVLDELVGRRCTALIAVPTMLRRIVALTHSRPAPTELPALRIIASGGAKLDPDLVTEVQSAFGPVLHNLYGSTEAAYVSIATPEDLLIAPECAGTPPAGTTVRIVDDNGNSVATGEVGTIYVKTPGQIGAYTDGTTKDHLDGMICTGDRGHVDIDGRLFIGGRGDGMIVSGGENVFPEEVEIALGHHPDIDDAAVIAVDDAEFGQRLRAYVVATQGSALSEDDVRTYVSSNLSRSRVPRDVVFIATLPRGSAGKVLRRDLAALDVETAQSTIRAR